MMENLQVLEQNFGGPNSMRWRGSDSEEEDLRQCASFSLLGCENSEVRWEKKYPFSPNFQLTKGL